MQLEAPGSRWTPGAGRTPGAARALRAGWTPGARWALVAVVTAALTWLSLVGLPAPGTPSSVTPTSLLRRVAASAALPHSGTAISTGALGLPDLPRLTGVASLLGQSTRTRVWWASAQRWRLDVLTSTGEQGTYLRDGRLSTWDDESDALTSAPAPTGAHLPRALDLQPDAVARDVVADPQPQPQAAPGALAGSGVAAAARAAVLLGSRRIAGRVADGVRVRTHDARTTLARVDLWVDRASGLPLEADLRDTRGVAALTTRYEAVSLTRPAAAVLRAPDPPGAVHERAADDLVADVDAYSPWQLPATLAALPALVDPVATTPGARRPPGVVAYGEGLTRLALVPLPPDLVDRALSTARSAGGRDLEPAAGAVVTDRGAHAVLVRSGALSLVFVDGGRRGDDWILGGALTPAVLRTATDQLLTDPPPWRHR